jgi:hypothetical protein
VTSQQIREEVLDVLYGENVFRVILGPQSSAKSLEASFSEAKMRRIRHIMVVYKQFGTFADYIPVSRIPTFIWQGVIPNLTTLHIVFEQPTGDYFEHFWPCRSNVANQMKLWLEEVPPFWRAWASFYLRRPPFWLISMRRKSRRIFWTSTWAGSGQRSGQ